jgi:hypothetical protein
LGDSLLSIGDRASNTGSICRKSFLELQRQIRQREFSQDTIGEFRPSYNWNSQLGEDRLSHHLIEVVALYVIRNLCRVLTAIRKHDKLSAIAIVL